MRIFLIITTLLCSSCNASESDILEDWFDGFNRRDWSSIENLYSEDALVHSKDGPLRGGKAIVHLGKLWLEAIPDAKITPLTTSQEGDILVVHWRVEGTKKGAIRNITPSGKKVVFHGLTCFRMQNDLVVEHWAAVDYRPLLSNQ